MLIYNTSTTSKRSLWPPEKADVWVNGSNGSTLYLSDSVEGYDDWCSALGANTLGYDFFEEKAANFLPAASIPWGIEKQFAANFCQAMGTEAVRFFKSGSDAVSCAVRLARAFTERKFIVVFDKSYHGTASEFRSLVRNNAGYLPDFALNRPFGKELRFAGLDEIAAIVVEPVPKGIDLPPAGWLEHLREVCDEHGILLVGDQVILGYRHTLAGYPCFGDIRYDLLCYGKAMGQGAAISACTGRMDVMKLLEKEVHFSGTNNGEPLPLMIAQATLKEYLEKDICHILGINGLKLQNKLMENKFKVKGLSSRFEVVFDSPEQRMDATRFLWDRHILFPGFVSLAISHSTDQMRRLVGGLKEWRNYNEKKK